jgi:hypothetical protein
MKEVTIPANATMIENLLTAAPNAVVVFDYAGYASGFVTAWPTWAE